MVNKQYHLSEIKKCLNAIPDEELIDVTVGHDFGVETCDGGKVCVLKWTDEFPEFFEKYDLEPVEELIKSIQRNTLIVQGVREGFFDGEKYMEETI